MDLTLQQALRERMLRQRDAIDEALHDLLVRTQPVELDQTVQGRLSRMDAITQQHMAQASSSHLRQERMRIEAALTRVDAGRYGVCCRCGESIELDRLQAEPTAPLCPDCIDELDQERRESARRR